MGPMPSLTWAVRVPPRALTVTETWPGWCAPTCRDRAAVVGVACRLIAVITSPLVIPARAAGLPGSTAATTTPRVPPGVAAAGPGPNGLPNAPKGPAGFAAWELLTISTPRNGRRPKTRPGRSLCAVICPATARMVLAGMAKPRLAPPVPAEAAAVVRYQTWHSAQ